MVRMACVDGHVQSRPLAITRVYRASTAADNTLQF